MQNESLTLKEAVESARVRSHKTLHDITGSWWTGQYCLQQPAGAPNPGTEMPAGTDFSKKTVMTQQCWDDYTSAIQKISDASGVDITGFLDPWGRPYYIDENDDGTLACHYDSVAWLNNPYTGGYSQNWAKQELKIPTYDPRCYS